MSEYSLKQFRTKEGFTQGEIADACSVTSAKVWRIESLDPTVTYSRETGVIEVHLVGKLCFSGILQPSRKSRSRTETPKSGVVGVHFNSGTGKSWIAKITVNGKKITLGWFDRIDDAEKVVTEARRAIEEAVADVIIKYGSP